MDVDDVEPTSELLCAFQTLGFTQLPPMLTMQELMKARNAQALRWHPNKHPASFHANCTAKMQAINAAFELLQAKINASSGGTFTPPRGQAGACSAASRKPFTLKRKWIAFTLAGLMEDELQLLDFVQQLDNTVGSMKRGGERMRVVQMALGYEVHKNPSNPRFNMHYHGLLELSHQTNCDSSKFDPVGASGNKLRLNIDKIESEEHWHNKVAYLCKDGHCYLRLKEGPRLTTTSNKRHKSADWSTILMEAATTALTPEHAVEALREEFGQTWVLQYDKLLAAAVIAHLHHVLIEFVRS